MSENNFILAGNGPYLNHGCEAIIRGTTKIINSFYKNTHFINASFFSKKKIEKLQNYYESDKNIENISLAFTMKYRFQWAVNKCFSLLGNDNYYKIRCKNLNRYINSSKVVLSVGGDNYSLDYGNLEWFIDIDKYAIHSMKPIILWGASVGPFSQNDSYEKYMKEHLKKVTAIFARESETVNYLNSIGIYDNIYRVCDPAFMLDAMEPLNYNIKIDEGSIGINISPIMMHYVANGDINNFIKLSANIINRIIKITGRKIYFIPHVVIPGNSDFQIMKLIYNNIDNKFKEKVFLVSDKLNASEYKWIISKMDVFFGARTHSTIAALSSLVPTLSFVYSIKSVGINKDLFGTDDYCIYPEQYNENFLVEKMSYLIDHKDKIKRDLEVKINESKQLSLKAGEYLKNIIG